MKLPVAVSKPRKGKIRYGDFTSQFEMESIEQLTGTAGHVIIPQSHQETGPTAIQERLH